MWGAISPKSYVIFLCQLCEEEKCLRDSETGVKKRDPQWETESVDGF